MSVKQIGNVTVDGDNNFSEAKCSVCSEKTVAVATFGGAWEKAKHWAIRHQCKTIGPEA